MKSYVLTIIKVILMLGTTLKVLEKETLTLRTSENDFIGQLQKAGGTPFDRT